MDSDMQRKRGRPKKSKEDLKDKSIHIKLTESEYYRFKKTCKFRGISYRDLIIELLNDANHMYF